MKAFTRLLGALLVAATAQQTVQAQAPNTDQFHTFVASDFHKGLINRALAGEPQTVFQRCPTLASNQSQVKILKPIMFGMDGFPNAGAWKESFPISGCGNDTVLNFYFVAGSDEKINTIIGYPGSTHGDPQLQKDALLYAYQSAGIKANDCKHFDVKNTRFEAYGLKDPPSPDPGESAHFRPWWETWTMIGCNHTYDVTMDFIPDSTGTRIVSPTGDTIER